MNSLFVGQMLYGFCGGIFGRDSHQDKRIEALGADWVVARYSSGEVAFAAGERIHENLLEYTVKPKDWTP